MNSARRKALDGLADLPGGPRAPATHATIDALRAELAQQAERIEEWRTNAGKLVDVIEGLRGQLAQQAARRACPCLHTTPCSDRCTCVNGFSSFGCQRCCTYGSAEQQRERAEQLAQQAATIAGYEAREKAWNESALMASNQKWFEEAKKAHKEAQGLAEALAELVAMIDAHVQWDITGPRGGHISQWIGERGVTSTEGDTYARARALLARTPREGS